MYIYFKVILNNILLFCLVAHRLFSVAFIVVMSWRVEASLVRKTYVVFLANFPDVTFNW